MKAKKLFKKMNNKTHKLEKENMKWRANNPSYKKGDLVRVTLNGVVVGVDNFGVATNIRIFLEDQNHIVDLDMPDENCNIRMR